MLQYFALGSISNCRILAKKVWRKGQAVAAAALAAPAAMWQLAELPQLHDPQLLQEPKLQHIKAGS
jgi:hypothetical protein